MANLNCQTQFQDIGMAFCTQYYKTFSEQGKKAVVPFYHPTALLTFHQHQTQGHAGIEEILNNKCQFKTIKHQPSNIDCHPMADGVLVVATGKLQTDDDAHPLTYSQTFVLKPVDNSVFIFNDIFRIILSDVA